MRRRALLLAAGLLGGLGLWQLGQTGVVLGKAWLAPILIEEAWARAEAGEAQDALKPWPWADTVPVMRLGFPSLNQERIALSGGSSSAMAFGPTRIENAPLPAFFGHRDTHFALLEDIAVGDPIELTTPNGERVEYRIREMAIRHKDAIDVPVSTDGRFVALVTCWPFNAMNAGGPMRYVVLAEAQPASGI